MEFEYSTRNPEIHVAYATFRGMNTIMEIVVPGVSEPDASELCGSTQKLVGEIEGRLSRHLPGSYVARINSGGDVTLDEETYMTLELCETMRKATGGYFDIAALSPSRQRPAYVSDPEHRSVRLTSGDITLDMGAFAKGFVLDRVKTLFKEAGIAGALVNFGNSSVAGIGSHPLGDGWPVDVNNGGGGFVLNDSAMSVSGLKPSGEAHIVDPLTGQMVQRREMVVVTGRSALVCEILSTAVYAAPDNMRRTILDRFEGYGAVSVGADGERFCI